MRKKQLQQQLNYYLTYNRQDSFPVRQRRRFVLQQLLHDLFVVGYLPPTWHALSVHNLQQVIRYWQKKPLCTATLMNYLTFIRHFLSQCNHPLIGFDNQSLGIVKTKQIKKKILVSEQSLDSVTHPLAALILNFQRFFGLTMKEVVNLIPNVHRQANCLWLTRDITFNQQDRMIPLRFSQQFSLWERLLQLTPVDKPLVISYGKPVIYYIYRQSLEQANLPPRKMYRFLYAKWLLVELSATLPHPEILKLIHHEMGVQSRMTLWNYLHE